MPVAVARVENLPHSLPHLASRRRLRRPDRQREPTPDRAVVILSTGMASAVPTCRSTDVSHCSACFALLNVAAIDSSVSLNACSNVGDSVALAWFR